MAKFDFLNEVDFYSWIHLLRSPLMIRKQGDSHFYDIDLFQALICNTPEEIESIKDIIVNFIPLYFTSFSKDDYDYFNISKVNYWDTNSNDSLEMLKREHSPLIERPKDEAQDNEKPLCINMWRFHAGCEKLLQEIRMHGWRHQANAVSVIIMTKEELEKSLMVDRQDWIYIQHSDSSYKFYGLTEIPSSIEELKQIIDEHDRKKREWLKSMEEKKK